MTNEQLILAAALRTFKQNDVVECIQNFYPEFTAGKKYVVREDPVPNSKLLSVVADDNGCPNTWLQDKFALVHRIEENYIPPTAEPVCRCPMHWGIHESNCEWVAWKGKEKS